MTGQNEQSSKIQEFVTELSGFAKVAEETLSAIERDMEGQKSQFSVFSDRMFAIRGTADQLQLPHIAKIAGLGEEIAIKASSATTRPQIRKCVGALWDALTTVKFLLEHHTEETGEEQEILVNRLEATLKALGGARATVTADEIEALLNQRG
jgi:hypothetical protein